MGSGVIRPYEASDFAQLVEIFWETSARTEFASEQEKLAFRQQYLDAYLSDVILVATAGPRVLGYVLCQTDTLGQRSQWPPHLHLFADLYAEFPAHLHINFRAEARGTGLGSALIGALEELLVQCGKKGLHLITAASARNVSFYNKNGFNRQEARDWKGTSLLFMGKTL